MIMRKLNATRTHLENMRVTVSVSSGASKRYVKQNNIKIILMKVTQTKKP